MTGLLKEQPLERKHGNLLSMVRLRKENCDEAGFNIQGVYKKYTGITTWRWYMNIRIGFVANNEKNCDSCDSCIGFGTSVSGCEDYDIRSTTCGNMVVCYQLNNKNMAAFGYILVQ